MDIEPGTSSEADKSDTEAACSERKYKGGCKLAVFQH